MERFPKTMRTALAILVTSLACGTKHGATDPVEGRRGADSPANDASLMAVMTTGDPVAARSIEKDLVGKSPEDGSPARAEPQSSSNGRDDVADIQPLGINPVPISQPHPEYPESARIKKLTGTVILEIVVDEAGTVIHTQILAGQPPFDASAVEAVQRWRYQPLIVAGKLVSWKSKVVLRFRRPLDDVMRPAPSSQPFDDL